MKKIKAVIFDLDGTLLDTLTDLADALNYALKSLKEPTLDYQTVRLFLGNGVPTLIYNSLVNKELHSEAIKLFYDYYDKHKNDNTKAYEGILALLAGLNAKGIMVAVVSNKAHDAVVSLNQDIFKGLIPYVYGTVSHLPFKPDPALVNLCIDNLELDSSSCIYVGDTEVDYLTAKNANLAFVAVTWGFRDYDHLKALNPDYIINDPLELLDVIDDELN